MQELDGTIHFPALPAQLSGDLIVHEYGHAIQARRIGHTAAPCNVECGNRLWPMSDTASVPASEAAEPDVAAERRARGADRLVARVAALTGLILACAYVRPDKDLRKVKVRSVKKKWKDKAFTAAIDRQENMGYIEELRIPFDEHIQLVLEAMQDVAAELGLAGE